MKKVLVTIAALIAFTETNVFACGEINNLTSSVGTVSQINDTHYLISVPEGTDKVTLNAQTDYEWYGEYYPREVSTDQEAKLMVNGASCGFGIYTYIISFKKVSTVIAENTPVQSDPVINETQTEGNAIDPNEGQNPETNPTNSLTLANLVIEGYEIDFDPNKFSYELDVDSDVDSLNIIPTVSDQTVSVNVSSNSLKLVEGENKIEVSLVDSLGNTSTYEITVTKAKALSNNNYLASITVSGYPLNFNPSTTNYNLSIGKEKTLTLNVLTESELATYEIIGNNDLKDGSKITIKVTAEDGSTKDYIINIKREFNIMDYWMYIAVVALILLLILLLIINRQKKKKKKMAPNAIETNAETAGVVQNIAPQNVAPASSNSQINQAISNGNGTLQYIEPTNIPNNNEGSNETSETEVFKL